MMSDIKSFKDSINKKCGDELRSFIEASNRLAFFLGSGVSMHHYPSWITLPGEIKENYTQNSWDWNPSIETDKDKLKLQSPQELQQVFQKICDHDKEHYFKSLAYIFSAEPSSHRDAIFQIINFNPDLIVTLNFDISIQSAYRVLNKELDYTLRVFPVDLSLSRERENAPVIMHLHGKCHKKLLANPNWLVLH